MEHEKLVNLLELALIRLGMDVETIGGVKVQYVGGSDSIGGHDVQVGEIGEVIGTFPDGTVYVRWPHRRSYSHWLEHVEKVTGG